nr:hypothetical protein [Granulicella aggregans]
MNDILQGGVRIARHIDGPMKRNFHRSSQIDQLPRSFQIDIAAPGQKTKDHPVSIALGSLEDVLAHDFKLLLGVQEVASARSNHYVESNVDGLPYGADQADAWGKPSFRECAAQLHSLCTPTLRRNRRLH